MFRCTRQFVTTAAMAMVMAGGALAPAAEVKLGWPIGREVYQTNEGIELADHITCGGLFVGFDEMTNFSQKGFDALG